METKSFVLLSLIAVAICKWDDPLQLTNASINYGCFDAQQGENGITHVAYCFADKENGKYGLEYIQIKDSKMTLKKKVELSSECAQLKFALFDNANSIALTFRKKRGLETDACERNDTKGCVDVYYISAKIDEEWKPLPVNHANASDYTQRTVPHIAMSPSGQACIFYAYRIVGMSSDRIAYISKASGSNLFSNEEITYFPMHEDGIVSFFTTKKASLIAHAFAPSNDSTLHIYTEDTNTWDFNEINSNTRSSSQFATETEGDKSVIAWVYTDKKDSYFTVSWDHGLTWSESIKFHEGSYNYKGSTIVKKGDQFVLHVLLAKETTKDLVHKYIILNTNEVKTGEGPFVNLESKSIKYFRLFKDSKENKLELVYRMETKDREDYFYTRVDVPSEILKADHKEESVKLTAIN